MFGVSKMNFSRVTISIHNQSKSSHISHSSPHLKSRHLPWHEETSPTYTHKNVDAQTGHQEKPLEQGRAHHARTLWMRQWIKRSSKGDILQVSSSEKTQDTTQEFGWHRHALKIWPMSVPLKLNEPRTWDCLRNHYFIVIFLKFRYFYIQVSRVLCNYPISTPHMPKP